MKISVNFLGVVVSVLLLGAGSVMTYDYYKEHEAVSAAAAHRDMKIDQLLKNQEAIFNHQCKVPDAK
jgi:hypothetical protein